jgi:hypothetical protein
MDKKEKIAKWKKIYDSQNAKVKYLFQFLFVVVAYGLMINFILLQMFSIPFTIKNIIAYGIVSYLIKAEVPVIISSCFPKQPPSIVQ